MMNKKMKRLVSGILTSMAAVPVAANVLASPVQASTTDGAIKVILCNYTDLNGNYVERKEITFPDAQPLIKDDRTLVPIRPVAEELGQYVSWAENPVGSGGTAIISNTASLDGDCEDSGHTYKDTVQGKTALETFKGIDKWRISFGRSDIIFASPPTFENFLYAIEYSKRYSVHVTIPVDTGNEDTIDTYLTARMALDRNTTGMVAASTDCITDVPAQIIDDRTYLPLRATCAALGLNDMRWDEDTRTVTLYCDRSTSTSDRKAEPIVIVN